MSFTGKYYKGTSYFLCLDIEKNIFLNILKKKKEIRKWIQNILYRGKNLSKQKKGGGSYAGWIEYPGEYGAA